MGPTEELNTFLDRLRTLAQSDSTELIQAELDGVRVEDLSSGIERLSTDEAVALLVRLEPEIAADVLVELPTETTKSITRELPDATVAHYLDILPMDDALDLREELGASRFNDLLEIIPVEDAEEIRRLLAYPEDSVGRIMTERFFEVRPDTSMTALLEDIRQASDEKYETINDVYVLSPDRHLIGLFSLRRGLRADPGTRAESIMRTDVITVNATDSAEDAARSMARYGFYALPVLDSRGRMVGLFTGDDAQAILREEESEDMLRLGAISGDAESYLSLSVMRLAGKRLPWLAALFLAETLTGAVMRHYGQGGTIPAYMFFLPLIIGAGGNAGSQTTTMITRALAIGEVKAGDIWMVFRREFLTSLIVGGSLGLAGLVRAHFWGSPPNLVLSVGVALPLIVVWATTVGSMLPIVAKRMHIDPAVMSAPFISTFVDATGLMIYFEIVKLFFGGALPLVA